LSRDQVAPGPSPARSHASCQHTSRAVRPVIMRISSVSGPVLKSPHTTVNPRCRCAHDVDELAYLGLPDAGVPRRIVQHRVEQADHATWPVDRDLERDTRVAGWARQFGGAAHLDRPARQHGDTVELATAVVAVMRRADPRRPAQPPGLCPPPTRSPVVRPRPARTPPARTGCRPGVAATARSGPRHSR
jgi:hypothetical protein